MIPNARENVATEPSLTERWRRFRTFVRSKLTWGRLYRTTSYFLERIGVESIDELPELAPYLPDLDDLDELEDELGGGSSDT